MPFNQSLAHLFFAGGGIAMSGPEIVAVADGIKCQQPIARNLRLAMEAHPQNGAPSACVVWEIRIFTSKIKLLEHNTRCVSGQTEQHGDTVFGILRFMGAFIQHVAGRQDSLPLVVQHHVCALTIKEILKEEIVSVLRPVGLGMIRFAMDIQLDAFAQGKLLRGIDLRLTSGAGEPAIFE